MVNSGLNRSETTLRSEFVPHHNNLAIVSLEAGIPSYAVQGFLKAFKSSLFHSYSSPSGVPVAASELGLGGIVAWRGFGSA